MPLSSRPSIFPDRNVDLYRMPKSQKVKPAAKTPAPKAVKAPKAAVSKKKAAVAAKPAPASKSKPAVPTRNESSHLSVLSKPKENGVALSPFLKKQKDRLLQLRDGMLDSMTGVARDSLRSRAEGSEASAFGMHQADAGSDAYDRDFALSLLSQEQDALHEIDEALKRLNLGTYGVCEMSAKPIPHARLEAIPFARCTVECQSQIEKQRKMTRTRLPVTSLFGLTDDEGGGSDSEEEEPASESKE